MGDINHVPWSRAPFVARILRLFFHFFYDGLCQFCKPAQMASRTLNREYSLFGLDFKTSDKLSDNVAPVNCFTTSWKRAAASARPPENWRSLDTDFSDKDLSDMLAYLINANEQHPVRKLQCKLMMGKFVNVQTNCSGIANCDLEKT
ncbi:hypothetical protein T02_825 [Trichinella nativa]|uniref:Uncharacterized protein n=1 Tax=Trichinella nativa TaxID=6335 RepID=A0A0V1L7Y6_9BILA|nr:hypothetical protein T02_825 [Trichinella nativa]